MFKVFREGVQHSHHSSYEDACRQARIQAEKDQVGIYDVFEDAAGTLKQRYKASCRNGLVFGYAVGFEKST
ncbi:hypothetical protein [Thiothrix winogradskyi]|uniref:Uncharacterized protein n=1 Tax=Thiothrix winogradskyi TaxID=96472 RepID=A0ABY3SWN6_9GAMM|nr:hypothetical protein [Thiothrix winogradskyi]UJS23897.1 hypothetical protein L2Y54_18445 [Thiothrix winogradskyi]